MPLLILHILFPLFSWIVPKDTGICNQPNTSFNAGEVVNYNIYYNVIGLYVIAGHANFTAVNSNFNGNDTYTLTANGRSNHKYDWIFKVRDKYESVVDRKTMLPYQFTRQINEGKFHYTENLQFNQKAKTLTNSSTPTIFKIPDCTYDVISAIYAARNINFENAKLNEKIYLNFFLDKELYPSYFKFLGRDEITTQYGKFKVIKLAPLLVKGTLFKDGEKMLVWVTDDENHIPVRIETPIIVGSIKVDMVGYQNLRHPMTALISLNSDIE